MKVSQVLGKRIEYLRKSKGWSQLELALESEVNKNYLCDLEKGRRNPSLEILERIADALNISLEELFKGVHSIPEI
ncbi:MAG: helix-turn-helix domain-containing protein [Bacilli bacterium]|nr:helix-turn-helix domain-containing protein [Bacilli bacterium]